jgi:hypothetical protein
MFSVFAVAFLATNFTAYPGFGDKGLATPRKAEAYPHVEATLDKGPIVELIVRCGNGTAIVSYSKVEHIYCGPKQGCHRQLSRVVASACGK